MAFALLLLLVPGAVLAADLLCDQTTPVGTVEFQLMDGKLFANFTLAPDGVWLLNEVHVMATDDPAKFPGKNGNPTPGKFAVVTKLDPAAQSYAVEVPLPAGAASGSTIYIAAHAELIAPSADPLIPPTYESAWAAGEPFSGKNWATYVIFTMP
jgi:hypothetical protein